MSLDQATELRPTPAPAASESVPVHKDDLVIPSLFISAAAVLLALLDPIYVQFAPHMLETIALTVIALAFIWWGTIRRRRIILYSGIAALLIIIGIEAITQPTQLSVPIVAIWPLRIALVLLVGLSWAFLMRPPAWLNRALLAFAVPTLLALGLWGGPATGAALFGWNVYVPVSNFAPYWLAIDSRGTLYASDAAGGQIWVFDNTGSPQGTIRPGRAPQVPTPGPGILPNGLEEELNMTNISLFPTPVPVTGTVPTQFVFDFCGIATDPEDNLYTVDTIDPTGYKILRFDRDGMITARLPVPDGYGPTKGCISVDSEHIYLASRFGRVYVLDKEGRIQHEVQVAYQPLGIATTGKGELLITGPNLLNKIEISSGELMTATLPAPPGQIQIPYQAILVAQNGDVLVSDWGSNQVLRVDLETGKIIGSLGGPGFWPGEFRAIGGMAQDAQGHIYVADWQHRVIQRFTPDGKIDSLWWAARPVPETATGEVEND